MRQEFSRQINSLARSCAHWNASNRAWKHGEMLPWNILSDCAVVFFISCLQWRFLCARVCAGKCRLYGGCQMLVCGFPFKGCGFWGACPLFRYQMLFYWSQLPYYYWTVRCRKVTLQTSIWPPPYSLHFPVHTRAHRNTQARAHRHTSTCTHLPKAIRVDSCDLFLQL